MISVEAAERFILESKINLPNLTVDLQDSLGYVLSNPIYADRDFPPFNRVTMDGIAINATSYKNEVRIFKIEGTQAAGSPQMELQDNLACIEVMTGAILPKNTDTVIQYEWLNIEHKVATLLDDKVIKKGSNIHQQGSDQINGSILIDKNCAIAAKEIAVLATVGEHRVMVKALPKIAVIATGDELVPIDEIPKAHQIRTSNVYMLQGALKELGLDSTIFHIKDDKAKLLDKINSILGTYDVLIISGGVSKGKYDYIPEVLDTLKVQKVFHKVQQKPGKPFFFGKKANKVVFGLPGNPISAFVCFHRYFKSWLFNQLEINNIPVTAQLKVDFKFQKSLTYFLQVKVEVDCKGQLIATPNAGNGSGDLVNLIASDGFLELPCNQTEFNAGQAFPFYSFKLIL